MPIEIKELHIKITVDESKSGSSRGSGGNDKQQLIAQCVEQVLEVIKNQKER